MWVRRLVSPESDRSALATHPIVIDRRRQFEGRDPGDKDVATVVVNRRAGVVFLQAVVAGKADDVNRLVVVGDDVIAGVLVVELERIGTFAARQPVVTSTTVQLVIARAAPEDVMTCVARQVVVAHATIQVVAAIATNQHIIASATPQDIVAIVARQVVVATRALDAVIACPTVSFEIAPPPFAAIGDDDIVTTSAVDRILASTGEDGIVAGTTVHQVVAATAEHHIGCVAAGEDVVHVAAEHEVRDAILANENVDFVGVAQHKAKRVRSGDDIDHIHIVVPLSMLPMQQTGVPGYQQTHARDDPGHYYLI